MQLQTSKRSRSAALCQWVADTEAQPTVGREARCATGTEAHPTARRPGPMGTEARYTRSRPWPGGEEAVLTAVVMRYNPM